MHPSLERFIGQFKPLSDALIDSWFIVDAERNVVEHNRAFFSLLPRQVARGIKSKKCHELVELSICHERCIAEQCWRERRQVRLDEIDGRPAQTEQPMRFVLSALPILDEQGTAVGALEIQRNVTDEAMVQVKYQEMLDNEARERERLAQQIKGRTRELLETNQVLLRVQKELLQYKRGLLV
jgi:transcriptional regulator with PAS, ATPase and Fis domain